MIANSAFTPVTAGYQYHVKVLINRQLYCEHMKSKEVETSVDATSDNQKKVPNQRLAEPDQATPTKLKQDQREIGGPKGLEPTRYGDWEKNGRCYDF